MRSPPNISGGRPIIKANQERNFRSTSTEGAEGHSFSLRPHATEEAVLRPGATFSRPATNLSVPNEKQFVLFSEYSGDSTLIISSEELYTKRVMRAVELLRGKWTVQILCAMREQPVRLSELKRAIPSASKKALIASLRSLEDAQVVLRRDLSSSVLHVEYELAIATRRPLVALLDHLAEWGSL